LGIIYYVFDIPIHNGNDLMLRPLSERRKILESVVRPQAIALRPVRGSSARATAAPAVNPAGRKCGLNGCLLGGGGCI
jgi:ATP-dependent DNA ligase